MKLDHAPDQRAAEGAPSPRGSGPAARRIAEAAEGQFRVVITKEANDSLQAATDKIGVHCAVSRSDLANYVFLNLGRLLVEADVKALRALHFDEKKMLTALARSDDELPEGIRRAIREHYGVVEKEKKRPPRAVPPTPSNPTADEV